MRPAPRGNRGSLTVIVAVALVAMLSFGALVVDLGWARASGTQLQASVDAATIAAAASIADGPDAVRAQAKGVARLHPAGGKTIGLADTDIEIGDWDAETRTFTPSADDSGEVVRITHQLTGVSAFLGPLLGKDDWSLTRSAIAGPRDGGAKCAIMADNSATVTGSVVIDSYDSSEGSYLETAAENGGVCSNGTLDCGGSAMVYGSLAVGPSGTLTSSCTITGDETSLPKDFVIPEVDCSDAAINNNNASVSDYMTGNDFKANSKDEVSLAAGTYYFEDFEVHGQAEVSIDGDVVICVENGAVRLNGGGLINPGADPGAFTVTVADNSSVRLNGNADFYGAIIAPNSTDVRLNGNFDMYGIVIGYDVVATGNLDFHADESIMEDWMDTQGSAPSLLF